MKGNLIIPRGLCYNPLCAILYGEIMFQMHDQDEIEIQYSELAKVLGTKTTEVKKSLPKINIQHEQITTRKGKFVRPTEHSEPTLFEERGVREDAPKHESTVQPIPDGVEEEIPTVVDGAIQKEVSGSQLGQLPENMGKSPSARIIKFYTIMYKSKYGVFPTINFPAYAKMANTLLKDMNEYQLALVILVYFDWKGATGDDTFTEKRLKSSCHPFLWLSSQVNAIRPYIVNRLGVDWNDFEQVRKILKERLI